MQANQKNELMILTTTGEDIADALGKAPRRAGFGVTQIAVTDDPDGIRSAMNEDRYVLINIGPNATFPEMIAGMCALMSALHYECPVAVVVHRPSPIETDDHPSQILAYLYLLWQNCMFDIETGVLKLLHDGADSEGLQDLVFFELDDAWEALRDSNPEHFEEIFNPEQPELAPVKLEALGRINMISLLGNLFVEALDGDQWGNVEVGVVTDEAPDKAHARLLVKKWLRSLHLAVDDPADGN